MKPGPVTKVDKRNKATSKKFGDDVLVNCDTTYFSDLWPIWSNPETRFRTQSVKLPFSLRWLAWLI